MKAHPARAKRPTGAPKREPERGVPATIPLAALLHGATGADSFRSANGGHASRLTTPPDS